MFLHLYFLIYTRFLDLFLLYCHYGATTLLIVLAHKQHQHFKFGCRMSAVGYLEEGLISSSLMPFQPLSCRYYEVWVIH